MASRGVKDIVDWSTTDAILECAPTVYQLEFIDDFHFAKPSVTAHSDPYVVFAQLDYKPDTMPISLPYWKAVVDTSNHDESNTLVYGICRDPEDKDKLYTVEAYESKEYLMDVHAKSNAIAESIKNTKHLRSGLKHTFLKVEGGFLYRDT
jgi:quinol monooxygenase YgiN